MVDIRIVVATPKDASTIFGLITELAIFEKYPEGVKITEEILENDLKKKACECLLLFEGTEAVAMCLYFYAYSTWEGQFIHMEDLYVRPVHRRKGFGKKLWIELGKIAEEKGCRRIQWSVLNWNQNAINFYRKMPVIDLTTEQGWLHYRLDVHGIKALANENK